MATALYTIYRNSLNLDCPRGSVNTTIIHSYSTSCTSCGGFLTSGKRPSLVVVGAISLDTSCYPNSPCYYNSVIPVGGFTLQVSVCFGSTSVESMPCSILVHLPVSSRSRSFEHIIFPSSA